MWVNKRFFFNFQLYRVGATLVADSTHKWHIPVMSGDGGKERDKVKARPWVCVTSRDPNMHFLMKLTQGVLTYIISHPGIDLVGGEFFHCQLLILPFSP